MKRKKDTTADMLNQIGHTRKGVKSDLWDFLNAGLQPIDQMTEYDMEREQKRKSKRWISMFLHEEDIYERSERDKKIN